MQTATPEYELLGKAVLRVLRIQLEGIANNMVQFRRGGMEKDAQPIG